MALVDESIQLTGTPAERDDQLCFEDATEIAQPAKRHVIEPAALDPRYGGLRKAGRSGCVFLSPAEALAKSAELPAEADVVRGAMVNSAA